MKLTPEQLAADENTSPLELSKFTKQSIELARIVASNPSATPEILAEISIIKDIILLQNLTANVNTPPEVLQRLAEIPIDKFLEHIIDDWEQVKRKTRLSPFGNGTIKLEAHCQRLADLGISSEIINSIKEACKIYQHIARNPNTSIDCLLNTGFLFPEDFLKNPILPLLILENPDFIDKNYYLQIELAKHPKTPVDILKYLREYGRPGLRQHIVKNLNIPIEWLEEIANDAIEDQYDETFEGIAKNPHTPGYLLEKIAYTKWLQSKPDTYGIKARTLEAVALHSNTPVNVLEYLAEIPLLMSSVAANSNTPIKVLEKLSKSESPWVRRKVALNHNLSMAMFQQLVNDEDEQVRHNLTLNPSIPKPLFGKLINKQQKLK